jgi:hypothetical protein
LEFGKVQVKIRGLTPLMMNRLSPESLRRETRSTTKEYSSEEDARNSAYIATINGKEQLYIPSYAVYTMIVQTSGLYKSGKINLRSLLAGTIRVEPEKIPLGHCNYEIDERPVVIQRARVLKSRAKIPQWEAEFNIIYNKAVLTGDIIMKLQAILEDGGTRFGLLDYRPQHKGWFGTFTVENYEAIA